ncbi:MAG: hypothetical protein WCE43_07070, partial [Burkholderiales bacterium]
TSFICSGGIGGIRSLRMADPERLSKPILPVEKELAQRNLRVEIPRVIIFFWKIKRRHKQE